VDTRFSQVDLLPSGNNDLTRASRVATHPQGELAHGSGLFGSLKWKGPAVAGRMNASRFSAGTRHCLRTFTPSSLPFCSQSSTVRDLTLTWLQLLLVSIARS